MSPGWSPAWQVGVDYQGDELVGDLQAGQKTLEHQGPDDEGMPIGEIVVGRTGLVDAVLTNLDRHDLATPGLVHSENFSICD